MTAAHSHAHDHGHSHGGGRSAANRRRLLLTLGLTLCYMVAEIVGGILSGSLALLADAGHMFSDAAALALSAFAIWIAQKPATGARSFGYYRMEILAALINGAALIAVAVFIFLEAFERLSSPPEVQGGLMMAVAFGGLCVNGVGLVVLHGGRGESLNVKGAYLHVLTDALGSVGALAAGAAVWAFGWNLADPAISAVIGALVVYSSWDLLKRAVAVLMEGAPHGMDVERVRAAIGAVPGVQQVHDLHVWTIASGMDALSAHVVVEDEGRRTAVLGAVRRTVHDEFGIDHVTIQIEPPDFEECRCGF